MFGKITIRKYHQDGTLPQNGEIFVFGSNTPRGVHGAGAAKVAVEQYGAVFGEPFGHFGQSFAIPTKAYSEKGGMWTLTLDEIRVYTDKFVTYTKINPQLSFFVTAIGCGLAGLRAYQMAPFFKDAINCSFPEDWCQYLEEQYSILK